MIWRGPVAEILLPEGAVAWKVDDRVVDLSAEVDRASAVPVTFEDDEGREVYRHSTSHVMAQAVQALFPEAKVTIGPPIKNGFYYDFDYSRPFTPEDLVRIEAKMKEIIEADDSFVREEISKQAALKLFKERGEPYKLEILQEIPEDTVSLYHNGDWVDLCRGPHVPSTGHIRAIKLLSIAGAYWRGDERNQMLQRIYGTSFPTEEALEAHLQMLEEAKRRDHRVLGRELGLFHIDEAAGRRACLLAPQGGHPAKNYRTVLGR